MIQLKSKDIKISTGGPLIAILNKNDADRLGLQALDRIKIKKGKKLLTVAIDISESNNGIKEGTIGLFKEVSESLGIKNQTTLKVEESPAPRSVDIIKKKLDGRELTKKEISQIIKDLSENELTEIELTYFVSACYKNNLSFKETVNLTKAIVKYGDKIKIKSNIIADKHCIGGVPNNRTTMIIVPIVTSTGTTMVKTSSRSITSPAGTADTVEALSKVIFTIPEIKKIVRKTNGCMVWGGSMDLATADEKLIKVRHPLRLDPFGIMLSSILAKKMAVNSTHVLIDVPVGKTAKIKTKKEARKIKKLFEILGKKIGLKVKVILTDGSQPIGNGIGPNLEARDVLYILRRDPRAPKDLEKKSLKMAQILLRITKKKYSSKEILNSGRAYIQFMKIIKEQKGNPKITPEKLKVGRYKYDFRANKKGKIVEFNLKLISKVARIAGAPNDKEAGIYLYKKLKNKVKEGELIFTIYSNSVQKLDEARKHTKNSVYID